MTDLRTLTNEQLDALRETGNIGAGHAATALSQLLQMKVLISVPEVRILPLDAVAGLVGEPDTLVAVAPSHTLPIDGWRMKKVSQSNQEMAPEEAVGFDDSAWTRWTSAPTSAPSAFVNGPSTGRASRLRQRTWRRRRLKSSSRG